MCNKLVPFRSAASSCSSKSSSPFFITHLFLSQFTLRNRKHSIIEERKKKCSGKKREYHKVQNHQVALQRGRDRQGKGLLSLPVSASASSVNRSSSSSMVLLLLPSAARVEPLSASSLVVVETLNEE